MTRPLRRDAVGRLHHVINRGARKRPVFETRGDFRAFQALLACAVRAGRICIHAFCLMQNHFHLLLESRDGDLSATMQWVQSRYASYFNRTRGVDGPLVHGRFRSIPVLSGGYLFALIRYIDRNPVAAGMADVPWSYRYASARWHAEIDKSPRWLARELIDRFRVLAPSTDPAPYERVFHGTDAGEGDVALVRARIEYHARAQDDLEACLLGNRVALMRWTMATVREQPGLPMVDQGSIQAVMVTVHQRFPTSARYIEVGLLRDLAGLTFAAVARALNVATSTARRRYQEHARMMVAGGPYGERVGQAACEALGRCFGHAGRRAGAVYREYMSRNATKSV